VNGPISTNKIASGTQLLEVTISDRKNKETAQREKEQVMLQQQEKKLKRAHEQKESEER
jgi:hypothetical protein